MSGDVVPVFSVIVRRFDSKFKSDIEHSLKRLQTAASEQPGYLGAQNSLSQTPEGCELVTVFAFNSNSSLQKWQNSELRNDINLELNLHPQEISIHNQFDNLDFLLHPKSHIRKLEVVVILIFWIFVLGNALGYLADFLLPDAFPFVWRNMLLISITVMLISYFALPWSSNILTGLKRRISKKRPDN